MTLFYSNICIIAPVSKQLDIVSVNISNDRFHDAVVTHGGRDGFIWSEGHLVSGLPCGGPQTYSNIENTYPAPFDDVWDGVQGCV